MNKNYILSAIVACAIGAASSTVSGVITREVRQVRTNAVNDLSRTLPCKFISQKTLLDALSFIEKELKPNVHQELLRLQVLAGELYDQREAMLGIPGVNEKHESILALDAKLLKVEKKLDDMLYNSGLFNWKSMAALGLGAVAGGVVASRSKSGMKTKIALTIGTALFVAIVLEWTFRGRRSVVAGNMYSGLRFIFGVIGKFFSKLGGHGGWFDKFGALLEQSFRKVGKKLDSFMGSKAATITVTSLALIAVAISIAALVHACKKHTPASMASGSANASSSSNVSGSAVNGSGASNERLDVVTGPPAALV